MVDPIKKPLPLTTNVSKLRALLRLREDAERYCREIWRFDLAKIQVEEDLPLCVQHNREVVDMWRGYREFCDLLGGLADARTTPAAMQDIRRTPDLIHTIYSYYDAVAILLLDRDIPAGTEQFFDLVDPAVARAKSRAAVNKILGVAIHSALPRMDSPKSKDARRRIYEKTSACAPEEYTY